MKKVAILLTSEPISGGEHQHLSLMAEALVKCNGRYFDVLGICTNRFWTKWCRENNLTYINYKLEKFADCIMKANALFPNAIKYFNKYSTTIGKIVGEYNIDLLICGQQSTFLPSLLCRVIRPVHDLMHLYEPKFAEIQDSYNYRELLFSSVSKYTDVVLVDSELGKKHYTDNYYNKRCGTKVEVLPFAVSSTISEAKEEPIDVPDKFVFYPAQFWEHKNHRNLVLAINILKEYIPDIHLVLVGSERNYLNKIKKIIKDNELDRYITILGFVTNEQIVYLYKRAVALVMPSYFGPTNIPPLEAMALGCPTIVADKYAMGEQVGDAGLLCDADSPQSIADCIEAVWTDEGLRQNMIKLGYIQSMKWTTVDFKKKFVKIVMHNC